MFLQRKIIIPHLRDSYIVLYFISILLTLFIPLIQCDEFCHTDSKCSANSSSNNERYILYDVNPQEGFNLRRDVYIRFSVLAHRLKYSKDDKLKNFKLVLPPWSRLVHWRHSSQPEQIPWGVFFDLDSLKSFAPVIEMYEFFSAINKTYSVTIDETYILQHFADMFESGNFEERMEIKDCSQNFQMRFFFYKNITSRNVQCLSYHGSVMKLSELLNKTLAKTVLFHHAEVALHEMFGNKLYWESRRSMRFNKELRQAASNFRKEFLNSSDATDNTFLPEKWEDERPERSAKGGPYLGVHLRRRDFLRGRSAQVPSVETIAKQIINVMSKLSLDQVFIATDATTEGSIYLFRNERTNLGKAEVLIFFEKYQQIVSKIPFKTLKYTPPQHIKAKFKDGGVAIIEQIICSYARHFIGTYESTFSFRIQEEREILGFPTETTFNSFCRNDVDCPQPSLWKIVF